MSIEETKTALDAIQKTIDTKMAKIGELEDQNEETKGAVKSLDESLKAFNVKFDQLQDELTALAQKGLAPMPAPVVKGLGAQIIDSASYQDYAGKKTAQAHVQLKNTILNSGGAAPQADQIPGLVPGAFEKLSIMGTVIQGQTDGASISYPKESTWVNGAAIQVEGAAKAESTLTFENVTESVKTVATHLTASKQALRNSSYMASYIDRRLSHGVRVKTEDQIVNGDGVGENMSGWLATGNHTVISPLATTDVFGLANKLKTAVELNEYEPDLFYMHPSDWSTAETSRRSAGDNAFIAASGAVTYVNNGLTPLLWGLPVVTSKTIPEGTLICKSRDADMYFNEDNLTVTMSDSHGDNFTKNLVTILAESAGVEAVFTAAAICTGDITGITDPA
mgnify:CR=1 FL=1